ncbi:MAG TPA: hypothetical protein VD835_02070 [Pyrinomonadaceae bacterium]|nr:hypothetical protein [Pyrinomonadaceae bacterium]
MIITSPGAHARAGAPNIRQPAGSVRVGRVKVSVDKKCGASEDAGQSRRSILQSRAVDMDVLMGGNPLDERLVHEAAAS